MKKEDDGSLDGAGGFVPGGRRLDKWDFALAKARYFFKDPVRATVQAERQHVIDWGDFCGLCLHVCDRPKVKTKWDPAVMLGQGPGRQGSL